MADVEGDWFKAEIFIPDGAHLADSRSTPDLNRALLFGADQKGTLGPPEVRLTDSSSDTDAPEVSLDDDMVAGLLIAAAAIAIAVTATVVVIKHGPKLVTWWNSTALPKIQELLLRLTGIKPEQVIDPTTHQSVIGAVAPASFSHEVEVVVGEFEANMSSKEAQQRLVTMLVAAAIIAEQMRALRGARIGDDDRAALDRAMQKLSAGKVAEALSEALEQNAELLDPEMQAVVFKVFGGGRVVDGRFLPLNAHRVEDALRLDPRGLTAPKGGEAEDLGEGVPV